jgi:hypothetical protein
MGSRDVEHSVLGRLLEEISWEGRSVRGYRNGGRGRENVLTAEVLTALDFLPRTAFLGAILGNAHGADTARATLRDEIEDTDLEFLPEEIVLNPTGPSRGTQLIVQPDALITTPTCYAMIEAKRIQRSAFQPQQLAREYLAVTREAGRRTPVLLLILGSPPPVPVTGAGNLTIHDAITRHLPTVHELADNYPLPLDDLTHRITDVCAWTTWHDLATTVTRRHRELTISDPSIAASITRLTGAIIRSVARHS